MHCQMNTGVNKRLLSPANRHRTLATHVGPASRVYILTLSVVRWRRHTQQIAPTRATISDIIMYGYMQLFHRYCNVLILG